MDIRPLLEDEIYSFYYQSLPAHRKKKADGIKPRQKKAQSVGAWVLYMKIKESYRLADHSIFNLSHSGDFVLCAAAIGDDECTQVGCDIEAVRDIDLDMAKRFFTDSEQQQVFASAQMNDRYQMFFRFWTLKESFVKALRVGLKQDTKGFAFDLRQGIVFKPIDITMKKPYFFHEYQNLTPQYRIAVCSDSHQIDKDLNEEFIKACYD